MKRFHVHMHVSDLDQSIAFYSRLFAAQPARIEKDYALSGWRTAPTTVPPFSLTTLEVSASSAWPKA